jgi:hypothetical protein
MKTTLLAAALALFATALVAAAPPAPAPSPQADPAAIAKILAVPAAPPAVQMAAPPSGWTPAVCVPFNQDCCHRVITGGGCWYCADEEPGVC